jgi:hypothetical protein
MATRVRAVALITLFTAYSSAAQEREYRPDRQAHPDRDYDRERHEPWGGDIHRFQQHDLERWRSGHWFHGLHEGRRGWWWIVGGLWYFYPTPFYPYPDPYQPPLVAPPPVPVPVPPPPPPAYWYYCPNPPGYYPYVPQCTVPWQRVPASAPPP